MWSRRLQRTHNTLEGAVAVRRPKHLLEVVAKASAMTCEPPESRTQACSVALFLISSSAARKPSCGTCSCLLLVDPVSHIELPVVVYFCSSKRYCQRNTACQHSTVARTHRKAMTTHRDSFLADDPVRNRGGENTMVTSFLHCRHVTALQASFSERDRRSCSFSMTTL